MEENDHNQSEYLQQLFPGLPQFPLVGSDSKDLLFQRKRWAYNLSRYVMTIEEGVKRDDVEDKCIRILNELFDQHALLESDINKIMISYENAFRSKNPLPPDALSRVYQAAVWFEDVGGSIPLPQWIVRGGGQNARMWLMVLILGFGGKEFYFARNAVAKVLGTEGNNSQVRLFVEVLLRKGILKKVRQGRAISAGKLCGLSDVFKLAREKEQWLLGRIAPNESKIPSGRRGWRKVWLRHLNESLGWGGDYMEEYRNHVRYVYAKRHNG